MTFETDVTGKTDAADLVNRLSPKGNSQLPSVLDAEGNEITYFNPNRITDETAVVDIGDSPNSNTGDPLRTAFIKMNNFIEAVYQQNVLLQAKLDQIDSDMIYFKRRLDGPDETIAGNTVSPAENPFSIDSDFEAYKTAQDASFAALKLAVDAAVVTANSYAADIVEMQQDITDAESRISTLEQDDTP